MVTGGMWVGDQDCRTCSRSQLEDGAPRAPEDQVTGRQAVTEVGLIIENDVALRATFAIEDAFDFPVVTETGHMDDLIIPVRVESEALNGREIDRAGTVATAEDQQAGPPLGQLETPSSSLPICLENAPADRTTGYLGPGSTEIGDRKGQANPVCPATQHPGREARTAVGLHQDQGQATQASCDSDGAGDETATPQDHLGVGSGQELRGAGDGYCRPGNGPECPDGITPIESFDFEQLDRVAGIPDEVLLGTATRAYEQDLPAPVTKRVGDGQGGYDVTRRPAGRDHDRVHL